MATNATSAASIVMQDLCLDRPGQAIYYFSPSFRLKPLPDQNICVTSFLPDVY